jgi:hypothetical protein
MRRRRAEVVVVAGFLTGVFAGGVFILATGLGAGFPTLDRYRFFFFDFVEGAVVFVGAVVDAPRHTPTATSTANPTLANGIIL